ncbi:MAG: hypothetical protein O9331_14975, partial [Acidovorax sp.]|nr:hypothetical protein [Acidovorax sp.]
PTLAQELDQLAVLIHNTGSAGVSSDALLQQLGGTHERRTLQRRLARLAEQGRITVRGEGRATRYHPSNPSHPQQPAAEATPPAAWATAAPITADYVPTSAEGAEIRAAISQPRHLRKPVGYQLDFLSQYHPNDTAYLPPDLREQLMGWADPLPIKRPQAPSPKTSSTACSLTCPGPRPTSKATPTAASTLNA